MVRDVFCLASGLGPVSPCTYMGKLRLEDGLAEKKIQERVASCFQWAEETNLTISFYAYPHRPMRSPSVVESLISGTNLKLLRRDWRLVSWEACTQDLGDLFAVVATIAAKYVVYKHDGVDKPLEFVVTGVVGGPPTAMVGSAVEVAKKYSEATDNDSVIVDVCVYETRESFHFANKSKLEGTDWKKTMDLLSFAGCVVQAPRGTGRLFVELLTMPMIKIEYVLFREDTVQCFEFVAPGSAKGSPDKIVKVVEDRALDVVQHLRDWAVGMKPRIFIYKPRSLETKLQDRRNMELTLESLHKDFVQCFVGTQLDKAAQFLVVVFRDANSPLEKNHKGGHAMHS